MQRNRICACTRHKVESYANMLKAYPERSRSFNALLNRVLRAPTDRFTCATSSPRSAFPLVPLSILLHRCVSLVCCRSRLSATISDLSAKFHCCNVDHQRWRRISRSMRANGKVLRKISVKGSYYEMGYLLSRDVERLFDVCAVYFFSRSSNSFVRLCEKDLKRCVC